MMDIRMKLDRSLSWSADIICVPQDQNIRNPACKTLSTCSEAPTYTDSVTK